MAKSRREPRWLTDPFADPEPFPSYENQVTSSHPNWAPPTLRVLGATPPRTGTLSLKAALEILGFGPVHHMAVLLRDARRGQDIVNGIRVLRISDGDFVEPLLAAYQGYQAAVDEPTGTLVPYLLKGKGMEDVKVILTTREEEKWWESFQSTIGWLLKHVGLWVLLTWWFPTLVYQLRAFAEGARAHSQIGKHMYTRSSSIREYKDKILSLPIKPENLLVYNIEEGWKPLCHFLGVPIPDQPFPRLNEQEGFVRGLKLSMWLGAKIWMGVITFLFVVGWSWTMGWIGSVLAVGIVAASAIWLSRWLGWWKVWMRP
ncbi:hypothetical protein BT69DRAFT_1320288 [Atractiella rhizophila]|nr:hypothetical protein BT69DRAFT_1320288 [Atractiella rhizophila]